MKLNAKSLTKLKTELKSIEKNLQKYQKIFKEDGVIKEEEHQLLNKMFLTVEDSRKAILKVEKNQQSQLLNIGSQTIINLESLENASFEIQEIIPDFLPTTQEIVEGCTLTVMNYGTVSFDNTSILSGGVQFFSLNTNSVEEIRVFRNCSGTILMMSNWFYLQDLPENLGFNSNGKHTSNVTYSISFPFKVDEEGNIQLFKGTIQILNNVIGSKMDNLFFIKDLEVNLDSNSVASITGGLFQNTEFNSETFKAIQKLMSSKIKGNKDLTTSFSISLKLSKEKEEKISRQENELVFEKENQAILSSDQLVYLQKWWEALNNELKEAIENRDATIVVEGYTSNSGNDFYNFNLGLDRAEHVKDMLAGIIGKVDGKPIARILVKSLGESKISRRYVKITVVNTN